MYTLYMAKGTSALAAHILLEEIGAEYQTRILSVPGGDHQAPDYLAVNPRGRVPALDTPQGVITENPAILAYLAQAHPEQNLAPRDPFAFATAQSANLYLASTMHPAFAHKLRGARFADDPAAIASMKEKVPANILECARLIEDHLLQGPWVLGATYSMCDPYFFLVHRWMAANDISTDAFPRIAAHVDAMRARPATQAALAQHGL
ncbi:glutathione S-transferase family protein [uncultured Roseobacter sp.]|uniref:glutathione S-transferase family protein n=1 Tax=uncultured Roseobacter sp. TaxID=114847 RepID=UPI0026232711|nr:glutathione S-transferase family protein [uncultured Roseobacter sp.]